MDAGRRTESGVERFNNEKAPYDLHRKGLIFMLEGDANGRVFTFPLPTYNVTADFDWDNPVYTPIWEMAGKYGIPYFANFIGSYLNTEDCRSMCPLHPRESVVFRNARGIAIRPIGLVAEEFLRGGQDHLEVLHKGGWAPVSCAPASSYREAF